MPSSLTRSEPVFGAARFRRALRDPEATQLRVLRAILARNAGCEYGRRHRFAEIDSFDSYRERVPVATYEELRARIERTARGEVAILTSEPVCAWEETGGSSGGAKLIPYTASGLGEFRAGLVPWIESMRAAWPLSASGRSYWSISPVGRSARLTPSGMPIGLPGDEAAYFGDPWAARLTAALAVPPQVGAISDVATWRRATLLHLVACEDLTLISVWSPTFLLELLARLQLHADAIAADLRSEETDFRRRLASEAGTSLPRPDARRAERLLQVVHAGVLNWQELWPELVLISCWDQARARPHAERLQAMFPAVTVQGKGLLATEGLVSIPFEAGQDPVLALDSGYFEFVDGEGRAHIAADVAVGVEYELLLTTSSGLYRYAIGDRVVVTGHIEKTPTLQFLGRGRVQSDLCGEKLDEAFVARVLTQSDFRFAMLVPQREPLGYSLILDAGELDAGAAGRAAEAIDRALCVNPQYAYARRIGQLAPVTARSVVAPVQRWTRHCLGRGQRLGDIKLPALHPCDDGCSIFESAP